MLFRSNAGTLTTLTGGSPTIDATTTSGSATFVTKPTITIAASSGGYIGALTADITAAQTTFNVVEPSGVTVPSTTFSIVVDSEVISVTGRSLVSGSTYSYTVTRADRGHTLSFKLTGSPRGARPISAVSTKLRVP